MRKYIFLTLILTLCACTDGGGSSSGRKNYSANQYVSGDNNTPDDAGFSSDTEIPVDDDETSKTNSYLIVDSENTDVSSLYKIAIDKKTNEISFLSIKGINGVSIDSVIYCEAEDGCSKTYANGEAYLVKDDNGNYIRKSCDLLECSIEVAYKEPMFVDCINCNRPHGDVVFSIDDFENGEGVFTHTYAEYPANNRTDHIVLGSVKTEVPLQFSDFGYWAIDFATESGIQNSNYKKDIDFTFVAGDSSKEFSPESIQENISFSGKALAKVSDSILTGEAKLIFNANNNMSENLNMDFTNSGWYDIFITNGKDLHIEGTSILGADYMISAAPMTVSDMLIRYYGESTAQEAVGTINFDADMQNGETQNIKFSFGAVKD